MASSAVIAQPLVYPSSFKPPSTTQGVLNAVAKYMRWTVSAGTSLAITGSIVPKPEDQDKIWFQLDPTGRPIKVNRFFNGNWRQFYTGNPYEVRMFVGYWATFFSVTGLGTLGLGWDGWAIANGVNGTIDLTNKFIIPGYRCDGIGKWATNVSGTDSYTGGASSITIQPINLPPLSVTINQNNQFTTSGGTNALVPSGGDNTTVYPINGAPGNMTPIPILPPFLAVGFVQFIGYTV